MFLKEITQRIDLTQLYKVESTCYYHEGMDHCPVLLKINNEQIKTFYQDGEKKYNYLLQVWSRRQKKKVFERKLKGKHIFRPTKVEPIVNWGIAEYYEDDHTTHRSYFLFRSREEDEKTDWLHIVDLEASKGEHIVDLEERNAITRVEVFSKESMPDNTAYYKHLLFHKGVLYMASDEGILLTKVELHNYKGGDISIDNQKQSQKMQVKIMLDKSKWAKVQGLFISNSQVIAVFETDDHQLDFNHLIVDARLDANWRFKQKFEQISEVVPRSPMSNESIVKFSIAFTEKNECHAVALLESGKVDFYYQMSRTSTYEPAPGSKAKALATSIQSTQKPKDVGCSFDTTYVLREKTDQSEVLSVEHQLKTRICLEECSQVQGDFDFDKIFYQRIKNHCKLFSCFVFVGSYVFVSHGRFLSLYHVLSNAWTKHLAFKTDVLQVFRSDDGQGHFDVCVVTADGQISVLDRTKLENGTIEARYEERKDLSRENQGEFLRLAHDTEGNKYTLMMSKDESYKVWLRCFYHRELHDLVFAQELEESTNFLFLQGQSSEARFILKGPTNIQMYQLLFAKRKRRRDEDSDPAPQLVAKLIWSSKDFSEIGQPLYFSEEFHAGICLRESEQAKKRQRIKHYIFFDAHHMYRFDSQNEQVSVSEGQNVAGVFLSDDRYLYTLSHKNLDNNVGSGLRMYDIWNCINTGEDLSYQLSKVQVGCQAMIDFSKNNQRFVFQSSLANIDIIPVLHRNTIYFLGMEERDNYLCTKLQRNSFIALDKQGTLTTWNTFTGKVLSICPANSLLFMDQNNVPCNPRPDLSGFEIYSHDLEKDRVYHREWYSKVLLIKKPKAQNQQPINQKTLTYKEWTPKVKAQFLLLEVEGPSSVRVVAQFTHDYFLGKKQLIYFSEKSSSGDKTLMHEVLDHKRYNMQELAKDKVLAVPSLLVLPEQYFQQCTHAFYLSPDFKSYLDIDRKKKIFVIRDTRGSGSAGEVKCKIPPWLMDASDIASAILRFKWVDNQSFSVVNAEGFERVFQIPSLGNDPARINLEDLDELGFHAVPLFKQPEGHHYYHDQPGLRLQSVTERLQRKYQAYKRLTLMRDFKKDFRKENASEEHKDRLQLYQKQEVYKEIMTVEYQSGLEDDPKKLDRYLIDQSFTFLDWCLLENLVEGRLSMSQISERQLGSLIYNMLPLGETVLHKFTTNGPLLEQLFERCHYYSDEEKRLITRHHLPFLQNFDGDCPMDLLVNKEDNFYMDKMLLNLSPYGPDHHSREIAKSFHRFIASDLQSLPQYLRSRVVQTRQVEQIEKGQILKGISTASYWPSNQELDSLLDNKGTQQEIRVEYIDIATLHSYVHENSQNFFSELKECTNYKIFEQTAIKNIIEFKWRLLKEYTDKKLFLPYLAFMSTCLLYLNLASPSPQEEGYNFINYLFVGSIALFWCYFVKIEVQQLANEGPDYFRSLWNYLDIIPLIALAIFLPLELSGFFAYHEAAQAYLSEQYIRGQLGETIPDPTEGVRSLEAVLKSVISLILWLKLLYFLRFFKSANYYVHTLVEVAKAMRYFLMMLLLTLIAFGDSLRQISSSNPADQDFIGGNFFTGIAYTYRMVLGDFDTNAFGDIAVGYVWILFILCTVFNMIIMMNLLIAIISEAFEEVNRQSQQIWYKDQADLIFENSFLIPTESKEMHCIDSKYLIVAIDKQDEVVQLQSFEDQVELVIQKICERNHETQSVIRSKLQELNKNTNILFQTKVKNINEEREDFHNLIDKIK